MVLGFKLLVDTLISDVLKRTLCKLSSVRITIMTINTVSPLSNRRQKRPYQANMCHSKNPPLLTWMNFGGKFSLIIRWKFYNKKKYLKIVLESLKNSEFQVIFQFYFLIISKSVLVTKKALQKILAFYFILFSLIRKFVFFLNLIYKKNFASIFFIFVVKIFPNF